MEYEGWSRHKIHKNYLNQTSFPLNMILKLMLQSLYFFLPAYLANMSPVLFRFIPWGSQPINEKWFGEHKTWRGLIIAPLISSLIFLLQKFSFQEGFVDLAIIDYADFSLLLGFLLGLGAILGDLVKSFFKRRRGLQPGERWLFWDQLDFVMGGLILGSFIYVPKVEVVLILIAASPILHIITNHLGYWLRIRDVKW